MAARGSHAHCSISCFSAASSGSRGDLARQLPHGGTELGGPADLIPFPERDRTGNAGRGGDEHAIARDLLDPPRARAEQEDLPLARLVDHLLVELADATRAVHEEDAEEAAVGDRARVRDRDADRALARAHRSLDSIPHEPGAQLGELVRRVAPREQVEHPVELAAREVAVGVGAQHQGVQLVDGDRALGAGGHELLGEHVERVLGDARLLDQPELHAARDDGALEQVAAELGEDPSARGLADLVSGAPDALHAARDRAGRLDLADEVDRAHVDAELERGGGHETGQVAGLQRLLDLAACLARERAVVRAGDRRLGELVQPQREPLGEPPAVDEDQRRAVRAHELEQLGVDRGPDRAGAAVGRALHVCERARQARPGVSAVAEVGEILDRHAHLEVELLAHAGVDDRDRPIAADEARDLLERALGGRQRDALGLVVADRREPLEREREVRAALGRGHRVHLVDDHRADISQDRTLARGQHQEQALGRRDQDVRRAAGHAPARVGGGVAGAHRHLDVAQLLARGGGHRADAGERRAQVALDVVVQSLERREVEQCGTAARRALLAEQAIEAGEEGRERLAATRRGAHEHVLAPRDGRPGARLCGRRRAERLLEPAACGNAERGCGRDVRGHLCTVAGATRARLVSCRCSRTRAARWPSHRRPLRA